MARNIFRALLYYLFVATIRGHDLLKTRLAFGRPNSLRASSITPLLLAAVLALGIGAVGHYGRHHDGTTAGGAGRSLTSIPALAITTTVSNAVSGMVANAMPHALQDAGANMAAALAPAPLNVTREAELDDGQSFAELLTDQGVAAADANAAMGALGKVFDLRKLQTGQDVTLSFIRTGQDEMFTGAVFQPEDTREITISRTDTNPAAAGNYIAETKIIPVTRQRIAAVGEIRNSLYEAGDRAGVPHALMASLIRVYSHDVDFQRDIHPGDRFEILYDQPMTARGKAVGEGVIVYAALNVGGKVHPIYRATFSDGATEYFDDSGRSTRRALLRTPVAAAHITSGFGMRIHPILGYSKMHKGVDFGASIGTPIFAAGAGVVDDIGFRNGYGRYIRIRHNGTLATAYAHMSRFNPNLYHGAKVDQGQVIGYVGMSGRATGPHLHFEVLINNAQVNPLSVNMPTGRVLEGNVLAAFRQGQVKIRQEFAGLLAKRTAPATAPAATAMPTAAPAVTGAATPANNTTNGLVPAAANTQAFANASKAMP